MGKLDPIDNYRSRRSTVYGSKGIVATSQPLASEAGLQILKEGGNAFDAAVGTAAVLTVVEPFNTGIGGDVFALYRTADNDVGGMQCCGRAPLGLDIEDLQEAVGDGGEPVLPKRGPHTVTPPGTLLGWEALCEAHGTQTLSELLQPAIEYAANGFPVTEIISQQWRDYCDALVGQNARDAFLINGEPPETGEVMRFPELEKSLSSIAVHGSDVLYKDSMGDEIIHEVNKRGGNMSREDLAQVTVEWVDPISTTYNGIDVYELPPNNQGLIVLEALNIAKELHAGDYPYMSTESVHRFVEALKIAYNDGHYYITDPKFEDIMSLSSKSYAARRAQDVTSNASDETQIGQFNWKTSSQDNTILISVCDADGNVVSLINSISSAFGSGLVAGDTGILLQNRGSSFSLDPNHPNSYVPGKKPFHTLIPAVLQFDTDDWAAFGVMGGFMQPQGHLQVISGLADYDMSLQVSLDMPRWYYRETKRLSIESRFDGLVQTQLVRRGHDVDIDSPDHFGGGQITRYTNGVLSGATDPRKDGTVVSF